MRGYSNIRYVFNFKSKNRIDVLTFDAKNYILGANAKTFCFQTNYVSEWDTYFFNMQCGRFFKVLHIYFHLCQSGFEVFSSGKEKKVECLTSKMTEKYTLSITMIVCQIEKWHRYIKHWSPMKFSSFLQLKLVRIRRMILLRMEVI